MMLPYLEQNSGLQLLQLQLEYLVRHRRQHQRHGLEYQGQRVPLPLDAWPAEHFNSYYGSFGTGTDPW